MLGYLTGMFVTKEWDKPQILATTTMFLFTTMSASSVFCCQKASKMIFSIDLIGKFVTLVIHFFETGVLYPGKCPEDFTVHQVEA